MSHGRSSQLREMQQIIEAISRQIMWVNVREEEELVFDWGDKNIDLYIPKKQESYSVRTGSRVKGQGSEGKCHSGRGERLFDYSHRGHIGCLVPNGTQLPI